MSTELDCYGALSPVSGAIRQVAEQYALRARTAKYRTDPVLWARERIKIELWSLQRDIAMSLVANDRTVVKSSHAIGKGLEDSALLPTPTGWTTMGEVQIGDDVLDESGCPTRVMNKSHQQTRNSYRITFDDGTEIDSWDEHQWQVLDLTKRPRGAKDWRDYWDHHSSSVMTTEKMFKDGVQTSIGQNRWRIPLAAALQLPEADLPIDPYVLGLWLADGTEVNGSMSSGPTKLGTLDLVRAAGYYVSEPVGHERDQATAYTIYGLKVQLRELGVLGNKHIPSQYLRASEGQRRSLLAGIMDGDGFLCNSGAAVGLDWTNKTLANQLYELLMTLGVKVSQSEGVAAYTLSGVRHVTGTRYRMNWTPDQNPFRARGKEWVGGKTSASTQRTIRDIQPIGQLTGHCIMVDSPRSLYLVGESMVPTHNTYLAAILVCWWIDTHPPTQTMVVSTAPTANQVNKLLWEYIRVIHRENNLTGNVSEAAEWKSSQRDVVGQGRKPADTNISAFQGTHAKYLLVILDEAGGIPDVLWTGMRSITTGEFNRTLAIGNPDDPGTEFGRIFLRDYKGWAKFTVSAYDTPNFTGESVAQIIKDNLISQKWVEEALETWGPDDARFKSKVMAEFPEESHDTLYPPALLMKALQSEVLPKSSDRPWFGVDVARFGNDRTVVVMNYGGLISVVDSWLGLDTKASAERVNRLAMQYGVAQVRVDDSGLGAGVSDQLAYLCLTNYTVFRMVGSSASPDLNKWVNARAYWHDHVRYMMRAGTLSLPDFHGETAEIGGDAAHLYDDLEGIHYKFGARSAMQIESKDEMRKRIHKSPDFSDALMYACAPIDVETDPLALSGYGPGDVIFSDPLEELMMDEDRDYIISPW